MDKLYYYMLQSDLMLLKYLQDAEDCAKLFMTKDTMSAMVAPSTAGLTVAYDSGSEEEDDDDIDDSDLFGDSEEPVSSDDYE